MTWTGSEMLVWGGQDAGGLTDTGGRSCASCANLSTFEVATSLQIATDNATLMWGSTPGVTGYGVYRGTIVSPWAYNHTCIASNLPVTTTIDPAMPAVGSAFYYLVDGRNACSRTSLG